VNLVDHLQYRHVRRTPNKGLLQDAHGAGGGEVDNQGVVGAKVNLASMQASSKLQKGQAEQAGTWVMSSIVRLSSPST
jgi:hypothetical protein